MNFYFKIVAYFYINQALTRKNLLTTTTMKASTVLANFMTSFIEDNGSAEIIEMWNEEVKKSFVKLTEKLLKDKKEKKEVDENAPKGARTSYILFCMDERAKIKEEFPDMSNKDVVRTMADRWNKVKEDDEAIEYYRKLAEDDRERALKDKREYNPDEEVKVKSTKKKSKSGYMLFCEDERHTLKDEGFTGREIMVELGRRWKNLKDENEDRYEEFMEKAVELKNTKESDIETEDEEEKPKLKKRTRKTKEEAPKEEEKVEEGQEPKKKRVRKSKSGDTSGDEEKPKKTKKKKTVKKINEEEDE